MASRLCKRMLDRGRSSGANSRSQSTLESARQDGVLRRSERMLLADPSGQQLANEWISEVFLSSSIEHTRRSELDSVVCSAGRQILNPREYVILHGYRGQNSCKSLIPCSVQRRYICGGSRTGIESRSSSSAHGRRVLWSGGLFSEPSLRSVHSTSERLMSTSEELTSTVATAEELAATDHQEFDERQDEVHLSSTKPAGLLALDLPKMENPMMDVINTVCDTLNVQQVWGPDTIKELEDAEVTFTPFLIQQTVQRMSSKNADLTWNFFQWARAKASRKLSVRAHVVVLDAFGRAKNVEIMKRALALAIEDGHGKSAWPYNHALQWCSAHEDVEGALYFWGKMKESKCKATVVTYTRLIDLLARQGHFQKSLEIFRQMLQANCPPNISTYNVLIHAFGVAGKLGVASSLFDKLSELGCKPNFSTYNALIALHVEAGKPEKALQYLDMMKAAGMDVEEAVCRDLDTVLPKAKIYEVASPDKTGSSGTGDKPTPSMSRLGVDFSLPDPSAGRIISPGDLTSLLEKGEPISVESKLDKIDPAIHPPFVVQVLQRLKNPDTALIFFNWAKGRSHFKHDEYSYCMMISILGRSRNNEALGRIMKEMQEQNIRMNTPIFSALITCFGRAESMDEALKLFNQMKEWGCKPDIITYTSLIHLLAKHGNYESAVKMFEEMQQSGIAPNARTYSVMIYNLVKAGKVSEAVSLLKEMPGLGCRPSPITFATIIDRCAKEGQLETAKNLLSQMEEQGIKPLRTTITVLDGAFRRAGMIEDADKVVAKFRHRRFWDERFKSPTEKVARELLFKDLFKDESETHLSKEAVKLS